MSISVARSRSIGSVVRVRGVVTVGPGWILGDSTIALQDATAGIFVRLPDPGVAGIVPGRVLEVEGALATPYGNLELRPVSTAVRVLEMGSQPSPRTLTVAELGEETEGLIARISATVIAIESSTSGSLTLIVEDASGEGRVFMHAPLGLTHDDFSVGERIAAIGLVGDRLGLYRLWPRNQSDTAIVPADPTPTPTSHATPTPTPHATPTPTAHPSPSPTGHGTPSPSPTTSPDSGGVIGIADALRRQGQQVTIEGTVTTRPGLLDTDGARVTVQDSTAAILIRLPGDAAAQLGQRLRISGEVGTYYGAPQLTATTATRTGDGSASPISVRSAPIGAGLEWRLVTVTGAIESVHRDGESWRAEINLAGGSVPIGGLSRSGIESTALVAGRTATVTGIAKRAYPTASDQRFAVVPRTAADINLGSAPGNGSPAPSGGPGSGTATPRPTSRAAPGPSHTAGTGIGTGAGPGGTPGAAPGAPTTWNGKTVVALADLAAHETETVAVGGVVEGIDGTRIVVNDGTGTATIRFLGDALPMIGLFGQGDMLNALGTVERVATGGLELAVSDPANVARLAPIAVSPGETAGRGPEATQLDQANAQVTATGAASTAIIAAVLLTLAMAVAAAAILAVPSTRNVLRERGRRLSESLRRWIVQLRSS